MKNFLVVVCLFAVAYAQAQIVNIPDANFKNALLNYNPVIDTNNDGEIQESEALVPTTLYIPFEDITDPTGVEAFLNLETLVLRNNSITSIDISALTNLEVFHLEDNLLTEVDLSGNPNLLNVQLFRNKLTQIDVSNNPVLDALYVSENSITELDTSQNPLLEILIVSNNLLTEIDVSNNPILFDLVIDSNEISEVDVSMLPLLQRLYAQNTTLDQIDVSNNPVLTRLSLINNDLDEIDVTNNPQLEWLNISGNNESDLDVSQNPLLYRLVCRGNGISTLDLSPNPDLNYIDCIGNEITELTLPQPNTIEFIYCGSNQISELDLSQASNLRVLQFDENQIPSIDLSQSTGLEFVYGNENLLSEIDVSANPELIVLAVRQNPITSIDLSSNTSLTGLNVTSTLLTELDLSSNTALSGLSAANNFELEYINLQNGNNVNLDDPLMQNNPELGFICVDDVNFAADNFVNVPVTSTFIDDCSIANGSVNQIQGLVTFDNEGDGCDGADEGLPGMIVRTSDGTNDFAVGSQAGGAYSLNVLEGTYTTTVLGLPPYFDLDPASQEDTFVGFDQSAIADFCVVPNSTANDLVISMIALEEARPGFETEYRLVYENVGTTVVDASIDLIFDEVRVSYETAEPLPDEATASSLSWDLGQVAPFETGSIDLSFLLFPPPVNESGDFLSYEVSIEPVATDETPEDNVFALNQEIVNSQDPNDKLVAEGEEILIENANDYLHYTVRFQNVGTASAINVRIQDELDPLLDLSSLRILESSHEMETSLVNGLLEFVFDGIDLPSVEQDPEGSQGYVLFKLRPVSGIQLGDVIANTADIYFDFNAAIVTNTVTTTVVEELSINEVEAVNIGVYPNPVNDRLMVRSDSSIESLTLYGIDGRQHLMQVVQHTNASLNVSQLQSGIYFLKVEMEDGQRAMRRVIVR